MNPFNAFIGRLRGNAYGDATRLGTEESGIESSVQSWGGSIITKMYYNNAGQLMVRVQVSKTCDWEGTIIFEGTFEQYIDKFRV